MPKILIIDDKKDNLISISSLLKNLIPGCVVLTADSGADGLNKAKKELPDTILLDIIMPEMDGFEVCKRLKSDERVKHIPVILLTAVKTDSKSRVKGLDLGADTLLTKPIDEVELAAQVNVMLRIKKAEDLLRKEKDLLKDAVKERTKALRQSEEQFRSLVESSIDHIFILDRGGTYTFSNEKVSQFTLETGESMPGLHLRDVYPLELAEFYREKLNQVFTTGHAVKFEHQIPKSEGFHYHFDTLFPIFRNGGVWAVGGICHDITESRQAQEALREERDWAQRYLDLAGVIFVAIDKKGEVTLINKKGCEILGFKEDEIIRKNWFDNFLPKRLVDEIKPVSEKLLAGEIEAAEYYENPVLTKSGEERLIAWHNTILKDEKGKIIGHLSSGEDITERKQAEEALQESEEKYRNILESIDEGYYEVDLAGNFTFFNDAMCKIRGYSREELMGMNNRQYMTPETAKVVYKAFNKVYTTGEPVKNLEWETIRPDGSKRQVEVSISLMKDSEGRPTGFRGVVRDVTERKLAEEERIKLQIQLQQAQKMEAIGTLAGGIAHDFNNILMTIIGYAEIMEMFDLPEDSPIRPSLKEVLKAANRAKNLVQQILTFSRQTEQEMKPLQLSPIVKEALKFLRASLPSTIEIRQEIKSDTGTVLADPTQMHQVLMNLCTNAGYAMREHGGVLEVSLSEVDLKEEDADQFPDLDPGPCLKLTVSDTGHGMDHEIIGRIFDPFFTTKERGEGTGMGLSVVHGIVSSHTGAITAESEPGEGSTFRVFLPLIEKDTDTKKVEELPPLPEGNESILFVDDEEGIVYLGEQILARLGYSIICKTSSNEALAAFRSRPDHFDLVVTDLTMPHMTGVELTEKLLEIRSDIPIILCTGFSDTVTPEKAQAMGIREFLKKPLAPRELAESVRRVLDRTIDD